MKKRRGDFKYDLLGKKFGFLEIIDGPKRELSGRKNKRTCWLTRCKCGVEGWRAQSDLFYGDTRSCGCLAIKTRTKHGLWKNRIYSIWKAMNNRCKNKKTCKSYRYYGDKGIEVKWIGFKEFVLDMHDSYMDACKKFGEKNVTIDRIDPKGHYEKNNTRWATYAEQARNKVNTLRVVFRGEEIVFSDLAKEIGMEHTLKEYLLISWGYKDGKRSGAKDRVVRILER